MLCHVAQLDLAVHVRRGWLITSVQADARGAGVGKHMAMLPGECGASNYQLRDGMMVPTCGGAA